jgi:hypothetical protein
MKKENWRINLNPGLRYYLEKLILESYSHKQSIDSAGDKSKAQVWVALGILYKRISEIESKINYLEESLKVMFKGKNKKISIENRKKAEAEVEKIIRDLASGNRIEAKEKPVKKTGSKNKKSNQSIIKVARSL